MAVLKKIVGGEMYDHTDMFNEVKSIVTQKMVKEAEVIAYGTTVEYKEI